MWNCSQATFSCHISVISLPKCWRPSPGLWSKILVSHPWLSTQEPHCCLFLHYLFLTSRSWPVHTCLPAIGKFVYFLVGLKTCSVIYKLHFFFLTVELFIQVNFFDGIAQYTKHIKQSCWQGFPPSTPSF